MRRLITVSLGLAVALALAAPARAADFTWTFTGSGAQAGLAASVVFHDLGGGQLQITLTNTGSSAADTGPGVTLSGILFTCNCGTLSPVSAITSGPVVNSGSFVSGQGTGTNVGGEWAYGFTGASNTGSQAITATGAFSNLNLNGNNSLNSGPGNFGGSDLDGQAALDGIDYAIVPSGNMGFSAGNNNLIQDDVTFVLSGFNGDLSHLNFQGFQYGTSSTEFNSNSGSGSGTGAGQTLTPEPTSLLLFGSGLALTAFRARRKKDDKKV